MPGDIYSSNVVLLLHGNGVDGSTTFIDSSESPKTATAYNDAAISTESARFGGASFYFPAPSAHIRVTPASAFAIGTSDFTLECWVYYSSYAGARPIGLFNGSTGVVQMYITAGGALGVETRDAYGGAAGSVPLNEWVHLAVARASGVVRSFIDGTKVYEYTDSGSLAEPAQVNINQYGNGGGSGGTGYIDEVCITIGVARYTASFTPPTLEFGAAGQFTGSVEDASGAPASRLIVVLREDTGEVVGDTFSNGTTGIYSISTPYGGTHAIIAYPGLGEDLPALILRGVTPV